jgi:hypothetical protein
MGYATSSRRVAPFGYPRITGCLPPPRGLSQAATPFIGSFMPSHPPYALTCFGHPNARPYSSHDPDGPNLRCYDNCIFVHAYCLARMTSHRSVRCTAYFVLGTWYFVLGTSYPVDPSCGFFCLRTRVRIPERRGGHGARGSSPAFPWPSRKSKKIAWLGQATSPWSEVLSLGANCSVSCLSHLISIAPPIYCMGSW